MTDQPFATVLGNMSQELARLARLAGTIDAAVGRLPSTTELDHESLSALQNVDLLCQSLECLREYTGALASGIDVSVVVNPTDAAAMLPLRDLARNLIGQKTEAPHMSGCNHDPCYF